MGDRYLVTSTEYQIKRLEAGGFDRCYTLTQNFRAGDEGRYRNAEFTMLEWARVGQTLPAIERDAEQMFLAGLRAMGGQTTLVYQGHEIDLAPPWDRISVAQAIENATGIAVSDFTLATLQQIVTRTELSIGAAAMGDHDFLFSLLVDKAQKTLGFARPVFLCDWPSFQTSSALELEDRNLVQRSELIIAGVEVSDGFPSLTDAARQEQTFQAQQERRIEAGGGAVGIDQAYLKMMREGLPSGAGMALGFDRMVMLLTDQPALKPVLAFAWDEL